MSSCFMTCQSNLPNRRSDSQDRIKYLEEKANCSKFAPPLHRLCLFPRVPDRKIGTGYEIAPLSLAVKRLIRVDSYIVHKKSSKLFNLLRFMIKGYILLNRNLQVPAFQLHSHKRILNSPNHHIVE